ncbi:MAG: hypothetical protein Q7S02_05040 [bacterium]|nr:hypothetical protein [bacterium]
MDPQLLSHLLQLAARTGDRLIVVDPASPQPFVLMGIAQYEALVGGSSHVIPAGTTVQDVSAFTPDPVVARANAELAAWRATSQPVSPATDLPATVAGFAPEPLQSATTDDERFYVEPLE